MKTELKGKGIQKMQELRREWERLSLHSVSLKEATALKLKLEG